jgi:hypothetical protein
MSRENARLLAGEQLPVFGPTEVQNVNDDFGPAVAAVRVDFALSREELVAALSYGYAIANQDCPVEDMGVEDVRREVEGYLAFAGYERLTEHVEAERARRVEDPAVQAAFEAAIDRAYPTAPATARAAMQAARYGDGTVTLQTLDRGEITIPEPAWCTGHDGEPVGHLADITHDSHNTTVTARTEQYGTVDILDARISHAPHAEHQAEPHPVVSARIDVDLDLTVEDTKPIARALHVAGLRLARLAADTRHLRGGAR